MASVDKSLEKFKAQLEKGSAYEGQQFIKTVYHRLRSRKLMEESRELLTEASCIQFSHDEVRDCIFHLAALRAHFAINVERCA